MDDLKQMLGRDQGAASSACLDQLEAGVWTRVREIQSRKATDRVRMAAVALALVVGIANGGLGAKFVQPEPSEMSVFTVASMSPLMRLEVG